jgi:putative ABC transport system ATP-binding protein
MSDPISLDARAVGYSVGGRAVITGLSFRAAGGEIAGVGGPSGSGKSSLLYLIAGLVRPTTGSIVISGLKSLGFVFQHFGLIPYLTALENVTIALRPKQGGSGLSEAGGQALDAVGLGDVAGRLAQDLSGGQQQRVAVARAIAGFPNLILADEPTSELDSENRSRVVNLLRERARGGALVVVSSDDPEVTSACDRVLNLVETSRSSA